MKHATTLMLTGALSIATGCVGSTPFVEHIDLRAPDAAITKPCQTAAALPDRAITQAEAERYWIRDRAALRDCRERHGLGAAWIDAVTQALGP